MAGSVTGQRLNAAQSPWSLTVDALAGAAPSEASTAAAAAAAASPLRALLPKTVIAHFSFF
jgi:hypothetical protein